MTLLKVLTENYLYETLYSIPLALLLTILFGYIVYISIKYKDDESPRFVIAISVLAFSLFSYGFVKEVQTYGQLNTMYQSDKSAITIR